MSGKIINNLIEVRQGDSFALLVRIHENGKPADLSHTKAHMQVRNQQNKKMLDIMGDIVDENNGIIVLSITPQHSKIEVGDYKCDIEIETADGSINTIFPLNVNQTGVFRITPQVTMKEDENV